MLQDLRGPEHRIEWRIQQLAGPSLFSGAGQVSSRNARPVCPHHLHQAPVTQATRLPRPSSYSAFCSGPSCQDDPEPARRYKAPLNPAQPQEAAAQSTGPHLQDRHLATVLRGMTATSRTHRVTKEMAACRVSTALHPQFVTSVRPPRRGTGAPGQAVTPPARR